MILRKEFVGLTTAAVLTGSFVVTAHAADDAKVAPIKLTPEEIAEKAARKGCKVNI